jgi:catechol 2,3-dioxygenase-like lactoylglutathione lyase family enzyme
MTDEMSLGRTNIVAFVPIVDIAKARSFYRDVLGLVLIEEERPFALVFDANGIMLRLSIVGKLAPAAWTVLGWQVSDIVSAVGRLESSGVRFERYEGLRQDGHGIWDSPNGAKVAWFKDPDGNVLSLSQHPQTR